MTSRTRTTYPLNQRSAAGGYEKMPPIPLIPWVDHYLANEVLVDDFSPPYGNWSPPTAVVFASQRDRHAGHLLWHLCDVSSREQRVIDAIHREVNEHLQVTNVAIFPFPDVVRLIVSKPSRAFGNFANSRIY